jgi:hypothetical protein
MGDARQATPFVALHHKFWSTKGRLFIRATTIGELHSCGQWIIMGQKADEPKIDQPKEKFHAQDDCSDRRPDRDRMSGIARPGSSRGGSDKCAVEVQQRGPESMALAEHQLHDY